MFAFRHRPSVALSRHIALLRSSPEFHNGKLLFSATLLRKHVASLIANLNFKMLKLQWSGPGDVLQIHLHRNQPNWVKSREVGNVFCDVNRAGSLLGSQLARQRTALVLHQLNCTDTIIAMNYLGHSFNLSIRCNDSLLKGRSVSLANVKPKSSFPKLLMSVHVLQAALYSLAILEGSCCSNYFRQKSAWRCVWHLFEPFRFQKSQLFPDENCRSLQWLKLESGSWNTFSS